MENELLPCPFCGGEAMHIKTSTPYEDYYQVQCHDCAAETALEDDKGEAFNAWNRRNK